MVRLCDTETASRRLPPRLPLLLLLVQTLLLLLTLDSASARRQLPETLRDRDVFCETCYAVSTEMYQIVKRTPVGSLEQRIDEALAQVCSQERLGRYAFPADLLTASCTDLIATLENDLGLGLLAAFQPGKKPKASATVKDICVTRMKACKKISAIPSLRQKKESSKSSASSTNAAQDRHDASPGPAAAQAADPGVTADGSPDQKSGPPADNGKDEL